MATNHRSDVSAANGPGAIPVPPVPPSNSIFSRRRKSLPARAHRSNPSTVDLASPEVISSLISSLSTISGPVQNHFEGGPRIGSQTTPSSPALFQADPFPGDLLRRRASDYAGTSLTTATDHGFGVTYGNSLQPPEDPPHSPFLHPDDAAVAPVVRMARAPSTSKSRRTSVVAAEPSSPRPTSRSSYASSTKIAGGGDEAVFGMISAEPGPPRLPTANSVASSGSGGGGGRKNMRNSLGLLKKRSREFINDNITDRKAADSPWKPVSYHDSSSNNNNNNNNHNHNHTLRHMTPRSRASLRSMHSMASLAEEDRPGSPKTTQSPAPDAGPSPPSTADKPLPGIAAEAAAGSRTPGGIGSGRVIPARESSLRHTFSPSSKPRKSVRHSQYSSRGSRDLASDTEALEAGIEAEQVAKRIQQLKDQQQKIKSELETDNSPDKTLVATPTRTSRSTRLSSDRDGSQTRARPGHASHREDDASPPLDFAESAPSPAVFTGKSRPNSTLVAPGGSKTTSNLGSSSPGLWESPELADPSDRRQRARRSLEPVSPLPKKIHKRTPSNPMNPRRVSTNDERPTSADSIDLAVFEYIAAPKLTQKVVHPTTGRTIAFSEVGHPQGHVVLCCLGMGLTRYLMAFYDELARTLNLRLVTLDRPGVGESGPYLDESGTPLSWPDDVAIVCNHLKVTKFSILAHSAGAIYALATALRIPQHIRGRIHLLAPWIPPSQLSTIGNLKEPAPTNAMPYSQRILRALPASFLKVANSSFMSATSASITTSLPRSPRRSRRKTVGKEASGITSSSTTAAVHGTTNEKSTDPSNHPPTTLPSKDMDAHTESRRATAPPPPQGSGGTTSTDDRERQMDYDTRLTHKIWELATTNANPAIDLLVCLERRQPIGFRYVDITRAVVIHHGTRDTRVPVDNVRWLGKMMRRCEVRVLDDEGHGLMASAPVMGNVLTEIAKEWEDWTTIVQGKRRATVTHSTPRPGMALQVS